jgi:quercetin 2,3-dioxygenase
MPQPSRFDISNPRQPWPTIDPFLFCVHHLDHYPQGNELLGPSTTLQGRNLGSDFSGLDGWSMYHGQRIPGFPAHPHRGFETVTIVREGLIDHSDSAGATARYGQGDVQWLTAGSGIVHCEMFPLVHLEQPNTVELFQVWLNLPAKNKMAPPNFAMHWSEHITRFTHTDAQGLQTNICCIAGALGNKVSLPAPAHSWASEPESDVGIFTVHMQAGAQWTLPAAQHAQTRRMVYFFAGEEMEIDTFALHSGTALEVAPQSALTLHNGKQAAQLLILQGRPIEEPVAQHGPFVMNTVAEIHQAFADYRATEFGGWAWDRSDPTHARTAGRFARHPNGQIDTPPATR